MGKQLDNGIEIEENSDNEKKFKENLSKSKKLKKKISKVKKTDPGEIREFEKKKQFHLLQQQNEKIRHTESKTEMFREIMKESEISTESRVEGNKLKSRGQRKREKKRVRLNKNKVKLVIFSIFSNKFYKKKLLENNLQRLVKEKNNPSFDNLNSLKKGLDKIEKIKNVTTETVKKPKKSNRKNLNKQK